MYSGSTSLIDGREYGERFDCRCPTAGPYIMLGSCHRPREDAEGGAKGSSMGRRLLGADDDRMGLSSLENGTKPGLLRPLLLWRAVIVRLLDGAVVANASQLLA